MGSYKQVGVGLVFCCSLGQRAKHGVAAAVACCGGLCPERQSSAAAVRTRPACPPPLCLAPALAGPPAPLPAVSLHTCTRSRHRLLSATATHDPPHHSRDPPPFHQHGSPRAWTAPGAWSACAPRWVAKLRRSFGSRCGAACVQAGAAARLFVMQLRCGPPLPAAVRERAPSRARSNLGGGEPQQRNPSVLWGGQACLRLLPPLASQEPRHPLLRFERPPPDLREDGSRPRIAEVRACARICQSGVCVVVVVVCVVVVCGCVCVGGGGGGGGRCGRTSVQFFNSACSNSKACRRCVVPGATGPLCVLPPSPGRLHVVRRSPTALPRSTTSSESWPQPRRGSRWTEVRGRQRDGWPPRGGVHCCA